MFKLPAPNLNRRRLLMGLATASAAGAGIVAASAAVVAAVEDDGLIQLGDKLPTIAAEYDAAYADERRIIVEWGKHWPLAPEALTATSRDIFDHFGEIERGLTGAGLQRPGEARSRKIIATAKSIAADLASLRKTLARKRKHPDAPINWFGVSHTRDEWSPVIVEKEALLAVAEAYEAEKVRVLNASGYAAASARHKAAHDTLRDLIEEILAIDPRGMGGVIIQAEALAAWGRVEPWRQLTTITKQNWGAALAASVMRIAQEAPSQQA